MMVASVAIGQNIGIAREATVRSIRVANEQGIATADDVVAGIDAVFEWAANNPNEKCIVSYSLISLTMSLTIDEAFENLDTKTRCLLVVAAGNTGAQPNTADACMYSPAKNDFVITVGSSRLSRVNSASPFFDERAGFSNYGPCVDIYAPGRRVDLADIISEDSFAIASGTSFSTPAVAGAMAILLSKDEIAFDTPISDILDLISVEGKLMFANTPATPASNNRLLILADPIFF
ncbi:uncharacterized protein [Diadema antillarum]|uniref:uncharacterized protein n=1 Tax=Diadema antillarum TaxID=105358 RepID=UPI003A8BE528